MEKLTNEKQLEVDITDYLARRFPINYDRLHDREYADLTKAFEVQVKDARRMAADIIKMIKNLNFIDNLKVSPSVKSALVVGANSEIDLDPLGPGKVVVDIGSPKPNDRRLSEHKPDTDKALKVVWPQEVEDGTWYDAAATQYDPDGHAWSKSLKRPSVTKDGLFRTKRAATTAADHTTVSGANATEMGDPIPVLLPDDVKRPEQYGPLLNALINKLGHVNSTDELKALREHPYLADIAEDEVETWTYHYNLRKAHITEAAAAAL